MSKNIAHFKKAINISKQTYKQIDKQIIEKEILPPHPVCFSQIAKGIINPKNQFLRQNKFYIILIYSSAPRSTFKKPQ